jgi:hypothetical protein
MKGGNYRFEFWSRVERRLADELVDIEVAIGFMQSRDL